MTADQRAAISEWLSRLQIPNEFGCACLGCRPGEPVCPCKMRDVVLVGSTYYRVREYFIDTDSKPRHIAIPIGEKR